MPAQTTDELQAFHEFLGAKLRADNSRCSEALDEWRKQHPDTETTGEDLVAIQEALADVAGGDRGIPLKNSTVNFATGTTFRKNHESDAN